MGKLQSLILDTTIAWTELLDQSLNTVLLDYFASSLLARNHRDLEPIKRLIVNEGGNQHYWLIGLNAFATAKQAALYNGMQAHLLDIDDTHETVRGHPSAVILSALFSQINISEHSNTHHKPLTVERFLTAYVVGVEMMARLSCALGQEHYAKGWHNSATLGGIAATAALCHLHQHPFVESAMNLAATQASGLRLNFGTATKAFHIGNSAQQAIQSFELSRLGLRASNDFLNEKMGFLSVYGNKNSTLNLAGWGDSWQIIKPGFWFKNYGYCSANSYVIDALDSILERHTFFKNELKAIHLTFTHNSDAALIYSSPETQEQGRFSPEYLIAEKILGTDLLTLTFKNEPISDQIKELMAKMTRKNLPDDPSLKRHVTLEVWLHNGHYYRETIFHPKGSPQNPYSIDVILDKLERSLPKNQSLKLYQLLQNRDNKEDVRAFLKAIKTIVTA